jgi:cellulose synthase/poly-beta-1,6-N-acetylglucosamine synthase-like glycosyltransferase
MEFLFSLAENALCFLMHLSRWQFWSIFWPFVLFDCGRYLMADLAVLLRSLVVREDPAEEAFLTRLQAEEAVVSVIIPAHNEAAHLGQTLASVLDQSYPWLEVLVVDDGSSDGTLQVARRWQEQDPRVRVFRNEQRTGKASAQNLALHFASGEFVVVLDADSSLSRTSVAEALKKFCDPQVGAVSCNLRARNAQAGVLTALQDLEYLISISVGRIAQAWWGTLFIVSGGFGVMRRVALAQVGGFDVHTCEDLDITIKLREKGWRIAFAPRTLCLTEVPATVRGLIRQRLRWDNSLISLVLRKYRSLYDLSAANFSGRSLLGAIDLILFQLVQNLAFVLYPFYLYYLFREATLVVLVAVYFVYVLFSLAQFATAWALSDRRRLDLPLLLYVPLFPLYNNFLLRPVRLAAHVGEWLFTYTYRVRYIPPWVGKRTIHW